jgi:hypothetical protein
MPSENTPGYGVENPKLVGNPKDWGEGWAISKILKNLKRFKFFQAKTGLLTELSKRQFWNGVLTELLFSISHRLHR